MRQCRIFATSAAVVGRLSCVFFAGLLLFSALCRNFAGISPEFHQNSPEFHQISPECHRNFARISPEYRIGVCGRPARRGRGPRGRSRCRRSTSGPSARTPSSRPGGEAEVVKRQFSVWLPSWMSGSATHTHTHTHNVC